MKNRISRRRFLSSATMLLFSAVAAASGKLGNKDSVDKPEIKRTSRKKADHYRELAG